MDVPDVMKHVWMEGAEIAILIFADIRRGALYVPMGVEAKKVRGE